MRDKVLKLEDVQASHTKAGVKERKGKGIKMPFTIYFSQPEMPLDLPWKTYPRINPSHSGD